MTTPYDKQNPFLASVKDRYTLSKPGSKKRTQHLVLDLRNSGIKYEVGDSVGVFSTYDRELVSRTLEAMRVSSDEKIIPKQGGDELEIFDYFLTKANISDIPPKLLKEVTNRQTNPEKKDLLENLLKGENREALKLYVGEHELWDFLLAHEEVSFTPQEIVDLLMPHLPRFYSISSCQEYVGDEVHLTIAPLEYESKGYIRRGTCTHYLCGLAELNQPIIPIFIQASHGFKLPEDPNVDIIMIGPGTGVAPFRAFMQERLVKRAQGRHWLFFGEWHRESDFFYEEEWNGFNAHVHLKVDAAFSRDQEQKVYVQHLMLENGKDLFHWLENGAYLYVCGDAQYMAKDVESALHQILQEHGAMDLQLARDYVKGLRKQKRYLRDVY